MPRVSHQALRRSFRVLLASGNCFQTASVTPADSQHIKLQRNRAGLYLHIAGNIFELGQGLHGCSGVMKIS
jgi:hypothetical protein